MSTENSSSTAQVVTAALGAASSPLSAPLASAMNQSDVLTGLTLAIAGIGPVPLSQLRMPKAAWPEKMGASDAWAIALGSPTGWYVLLTQDCDLARDVNAEPTLLIAPLVLVDDARWNEANRGYSARYFPYPSAKFSGIPAKHGLVADLAWTTSILRGAIAAPGVEVVRPLTGAQRHDFTDWLTARGTRAAHHDDVVRDVLDPCYEVRKRLGAGFDRATGSGSAKLEQRAVAAAPRWYVHVEGRQVTLLAEVTAPRLAVAGFSIEDTVKLTQELATASTRVTAQITAAMNRANATSGYICTVQFADLNYVSGAEFIAFSRLMR